MIRELPSISSSAYGLSTTDNILIETDAGRKRIGVGALLGQTSHYDMPWERQTPWEQQEKLDKIIDNIIEPKEEYMRRLVKVIIVDPNDNVPLDKAVLYMGSEILTDLTDTELFYDIDVKTLLKTHNEYRVSVKDKEASRDREKDIYLDEVRISELKMVVLKIATF